MFLRSFLKHPAEGTLVPSICARWSFGESAWVRFVQRLLACLHGIVFSFASACVTASGWDASTHDSVALWLCGSKVTGPSGLGECLAVPWFAG